MLDSGQRTKPAHVRGERSKSTAAHCSFGGRASVAEKLPSPVWVG
ncbi:hypothetical protein B4113_1589 [Geobacillus sp. B4113_201601]|nr:hypothetical protein B4113_1589 [Geobacillus sp. B4113_201601]